jgi:hypothetical protein
MLSQHVAMQVSQTNARLDVHCAVDRRTRSDMASTPLIEDGYQFLTAADMRRALEGFGSLADWPAFAASWNDLAVDQYLAAAARCRRRRFAVYTATRDDAIERQPHQPHTQTVEYNRLFGGVERWFEPIAPAIGDSASLATILRFSVRTFGALAPDVPTWRIEVHQFRIEARVDAPGQPTPEGVHRDGVDYVLVLLVGRDNIVSGETTVYDLNRKPLGAFTLTDPFDATLVDDARVAHGVTPVTPLDPGRCGYRDVLVVTLRRASAS